MSENHTARLVRELRDIVSAMLDVRFVLCALGLLNLFGALVVPTCWHAIKARTSTEWHDNHRQLIDSGALVEHPEVAGASPDSDSWLWRSLLPNHNRRLANLATVLTVALAAQGIVLLALAAVRRRE